jgi:predicted nucleic acid-binding protein
MIVLFDTNVVLDVLLDRDPFAEASLLLFHRVEQKRVQGYLCATTLTDIYYIARPDVGKVIALKRIRELLDLFEIAVVNRSILTTAAHGDFLDFEDAVLYESAKQVGVDAIVTRNRHDFEKSEIPIYAPDDLNALLDLEENDH